MPFLPQVKNMLALEIHSLLKIFFFHYLKNSNLFESICFFCEWMKGKNTQNISLFLDLIQTDFFKLAKYMWERIQYRHSKQKWFQCSRIKENPRQSEEGKPLGENKWTCSLLLLGKTSKQMWGDWNTQLLNWHEKNIHTETDGAFNSSLNRWGEGFLSCLREIESYT